MKVISLFDSGKGKMPTSPRQLELDTLDFPEARSLNKKWHSRLPRFGTGFVKNMPFLCFGAHFDGNWYAVAIWSNPVARLLPQVEWMELRRLAIAPEAPKFTASWMLGKMVKTIRACLPDVTNLISYQDTDVHTGTIYRASGWTATTLSDGGNWTRPNCGRNRPAAQTESVKQRWEKRLGTETHTTDDDSSESTRAIPNLSLPGRGEDYPDQRDGTGGVLFGNAPIDG